jgi:hypothetical protein
MMSELRARLIWWRCRLAYAVYMALPWFLARRAGFLLPAVGAYAHCEDFETFKRETTYFR